MISEINVCPESIKISTQHLDVSGLVTFSALSDAGETEINGANITTGKIKASRIDTTDLMAENIGNSSESLFGSIGTTPSGTKGFSIRNASSEQVFAIAINDNISTPNATLWACNFPFVVGDDGATMLMFCGGTGGLANLKSVITLTSNSITFSTAGQGTKCTINSSGIHGTINGGVTDDVPVKNWTGDGSRFLEFVDGAYVGCHDE